MAQGAMSYKGSALIRLVIFFLLSLLLTESGIAATINTRSLTSRRSKTQTVSQSQRAKKRINRLARSRASRTRKARIVRAGHRPWRYYERFTPHAFPEAAIEGH